jgi:hypothetical protein
VGASQDEGPRPVREREGPWASASGERACAAGSIPYRFRRKALKRTDETGGDSYGQGADVSGHAAITSAIRAEQQPWSSNIDDRELQSPDRATAIATPMDRIALAGTTTEKPHPGSIQSGAPPAQLDAAGSVLGASSAAHLGDALRPHGRRGDTASDVSGVPAGEPTLGVGAPAAAVARVGAHGAAAPLEGRRRIRRTRPRRRLRSHGLASDPQRVGRPLRPDRRHRHRRGPAQCRSFISGGRRNLQRRTRRR